jgi:UDP-glucose 4-epimerase
MKILITGGCGFIGLNLINELINKNIEDLVIVDNLSNSSIENLETLISSFGNIKKNTTTGIRGKDSLDSIEYIVSNTKIRVYIADICDVNTSIFLCKGVESVIHLAGQTSVQPSLKDPVNDFNNNIIGSFNYLESCRVNNVSKFIVASSAAVLGNSPSPQREDYPYRPLSPYGASKSAIESYCSSYYNSFGVNTIALRFSNVYGPYSWNKGSVVAKFIKRIMCQKNIVINGDGLQTRDFLHVSNIVDVITDIVFDTNNKIFEYGSPLNIATGIQTTVNELCNKIKRKFNKKINIVHGEKLDGDVSSSSPSVEKLSKVASVDSFYSLDDKLEETIEWFSYNV